MVRLSLLFYSENEQQIRSLFLFFNYNRLSATISFLFCACLLFSFELTKENCSKLIIFSFRHLQTALVDFRASTQTKANAKKSISPFPLCYTCRFQVSTRGECGNEEHKPIKRCFSFVANVFHFIFSILFLNFFPLGFSCLSQKLF